MIVIIAVLIHECELRLVTLLIVLSPVLRGLIVRLLSAFPVFISPEYVLSKTFHKDVIFLNIFRSLLCLFAIDRIHIVENWKFFRPIFAELQKLRARLPQEPYLDYTTALG